MQLTFYSFFTAVIWCNLFAIIIYILLRKNKLILSIGIQVFLVLFVFTLLRLVVNVEFSFTRIFPSYVVFPAIQRFYRLTPLTGISAKLDYTIAEILIAIWIGGSCCCLLKAAIKEHRFMQQMSCESVTQDTRMLSILHQIAQEGASEVRIVVTENVTIPMIAGLHSPTIYLPDISLSDTEIHAVLLHEWTHYIHRDLWTKTLLYWLCAIFWWNPFFLLLKHSIDNALEIHSDLSLTLHMTQNEKLDYLQAILDIAKRTHQTKKLSSACALYLIPKSKESILKQRMELVLNYRSSSTRRRVETVLLTLLMSLLYVSTYLFVLQPDNGSPDEVRQGLAFEIDYDAMYISENPDGTYDLYERNVYICSLNQDDVTKEPFSLIQKKIKGEKTNETN